MTHTKYPTPMIILHHIVAVLMISCYFLADYTKIHKSLGALLLIFACIRLVVRLTHLGKTPPSINPPKDIHYIIEKSVHGLLYVMIFLQPTLGWIVSNAYGYPVSVFGLFSLPTIVDHNPALAFRVFEVHHLLGKMFFALLIAHVAGAAYHLFKEKQNVFKRMWF